MAATKTVCNITRSAFRANAKPIGVNLGGQLMNVMPRPHGFQTGSEGYYASGKITLEVGGVPVLFQVGITLTAVGSKELPDVSDETAAS